MAMSVQVTSSTVHADGGVPVGGLLDGLAGAGPYGVGVATVGIPTVRNSSSVTTPTWRSRPR